MFSLKEGQVLMCEMVDEAVNDLKPKIARLGFPYVSADAEVEQLEEPYRVNIHLHLNTGKPERIKKIVISGAGKEDEAIRKVMQLSEGDVYNQSVLRKDIGRIKACLKSNAYFKPDISQHTFIDGTLTLYIHPGKRLKISMEGNDSISTKKLLQEMPFLVVQDFNDDIVAEAAHRLVSLYHTKGYNFAKVEPVSAFRDDLVILTFVINEGPQVKTHTITFVGSSLKDKNLKEIIFLKEDQIFNPDILDSDRETLKAFYHSLGYLSSDIEEFQTRYEKDSQRMDILITVHEGLKTEIERIDIVGAHLVSEGEVRKVLNMKSGDTYNEVDISDARYRVIELYANKGFPEVKVSVKRSFEGQKASLIFRIDEGPEKYFGKVVVSGNYKTKYHVIQRELLQREGQPFDNSIIIRERQRLYKLGLFTDVDIDVLDSHDNKKDVLVKLREGNAGAVEFSLGYAEYERYRGIIDLSYRNLWGMNRQSSLRLELSSLEKRYILQYYEPWFLGKPLPFKAFLLGEDKKEINIDTRETRYRLIRHTASVGFEKKISEVLRPELYYEFSVVRTFDVKPDVVLSKEDKGTLIISGIRAGLIFDTRDNPFYPAKGILTGLSVKLTSPVFLSETNFIKLTFYGNVYHGITKGIVLAASLRGGIAQGYHKTDELPIVERFFLGGRTTVRGYEQDTLGPKGSDGTPTGGNVFLMENLEIRTSLGRGFGIVAFLDGGNVWLKTKDVDPLNFKFTTGLGLRYNTPVGPLSIDYGHKLQREKGESTGEIHFSIGHAF
jgi:outer membrane protein insertion porin family